LQKIGNVFWQRLLGKYAGKVKVGQGNRKQSRTAGGGGDISPSLKTNFGVVPFCQAARAYSLSLTSGKPVEVSSGIFQFWTLLYWQLM
jgi:hypothetical protein